MRKVFSERKIPLANEAAGSVAKPAKRNKAATRTDTKNILILIFIINIQ